MIELAMTEREMVVSLPISSSSAGIFCFLFFCPTPISAADREGLPRFRLSDGKPSSSRSNLRNGLS